MSAIIKAKPEFPIFERRINGKNLYYLDSAASSQKPRAVIEAISDFYQNHYANVHRSIHTLGAEATEAYERAREVSADFLNAKDKREIVLTSGTTFSINLVAHGLSELLSAGDEILITHLEHHANIVPWQELCKKTGAKLQVASVNDLGELIETDFLEKLNSKTKLVAISHVSNAIGTVNPVKSLTAAAKEVGALVLIDGAQAVAHRKVDVQDFGCDFYVFSAHKLYGPTGIGVLYGKLELLNKMPPFLTGGEMIRKVTFEKTIFADAPVKFEAGTPNIAGAVGMTAAIQWLSQFSWKDIASHEQQLTDYAVKSLKLIPSIKLIGEPQERSGSISFVLKEAHAHDVATILDGFGVAVRAGHHCAMPLMERFQVDATARASFAIYNNQDDVDALCDALKQVVRLFS